MKAALSSPAQVKKIHALAQVLGLIDGSDDGTYREMLRSYGVASSKELSFKLAGEVISSLEKSAAEMGLWVKNKPQGREKHNDLKNRDSEMATPKQLRYIEGLWANVSRAKTPDDRTTALRHFTEKLAGVSDIRFLDKQGASVMINALKAMKEAK
jgi:hypothetical protein